MEGAGDWTSASFLDNLFLEGFSGMDSLTEETVARALGATQETAARSIGFLGPKGMIR